ncbi:MAG: hypothetical protein ABIV39_17965 [Verrucomicrobiota bacterium]
MEPDYQLKLEKAIHRELGELPDRPAPKELVSSVLAIIQARSVRPWYRCAWPAWPAALQIASLALLISLFGGLCFAGWKFSHAESLSTALHPLAEFLSTIEVIWNALCVLGSALLLALKQLKPVFLVGGIAVAFLSYAMCIGLGTALFHHVRHPKNY